jgi:RNA polymerase sigma-B factor
MDVSSTSPNRRPIDDEGRRPSGDVRRRTARELAVAYAETGDRRYRNDLVQLHLDVAETFVRRYRRAGISAEDLRQAALLAMVRCVDRFDLDQEVEFATFASRTIDGELKRFFRDRTWAVRPPRRAQELHLRVRRAEDELTQELGRVPTVRELAENLDETVDTVLEAQEVSHSYYSTSLDAPIAASTDPEDLVLADAVLGERDGGFDLIEVRDTVRRLVADLDENDRLIVRMRFEENRTQEEIAELVGVSQSYLSRLLHRILARLRAQLESEGSTAARSTTRTR